MNSAVSLDLETLAGGYASGALEPRAVLEDVFARIEARGVRPIWIELVPKADALALLEHAASRRAGGEALPLFGVPFAIKDNIDVRRTVRTEAGWRVVGAHVSLLPAHDRGCLLMP